jgi:hypothetical protein
MMSLSERVSALVEHPLHQQLTTAETAPASVEPEELLVIDARWGLTPAQMVEQKLLALLGSNYPGLRFSGSGRGENIRRTFFRCTAG